MYKKLTKENIKSIITEAVYNGGGTHKLGFIKTDNIGYVINDAQPSKGYAVAFDYSVVLPLEDVYSRFNMVRTFIADLIEFNYSYVGFWVNNGSLYIEAVTVKDLQSEAHKIALNEAQKSYYDLYHGKEIITTDVDPMFTVAHVEGFILTVSYERASVYGLHTPVYRVYKYSQAKHVECGLPVDISGIYDYMFKSSDLNQALKAIDVLNNLYKGVL